MKNTEHVNVSVVLHQVSDPVMPVEQDADVSRRGMVAVSNIGELGEYLCPLVNPPDCASRSVGIIRSDVLEDVFEPALSLFGSRYCCHARMRRPISSFEMVRFASESASPRSTIT
jgi:hypothetical protein